MPTIKATPDNPHALSNKQRLVIEDIVSDIKQGKKLNAVKSTGKIYNTSTPNSTAVQSNQNLKKPNFRNALIDALQDNKIIGNNSVVSTKIMEGLDAVNEGKHGMIIDYKTRLQYIQEINKITGVYAPEKTDKRTLKINVNMSSEELQSRIIQLQDELEMD